MNDNYVVLKRYQFSTETTFGGYCHCLHLSVHVCVCPRVRQPWACLRDNLWLIQARITKFGPEVQKTLVKISIVLGAIILDIQSQI